MADPNDPTQQAFEKVVQEFKSRLNDDELYSEILKTKSIDEVYDLTDRLQEEQVRKGRLRNLSKIQPFLEGLRSYASVIEVFMQVKPDVLALIWGPIKLLIQWTSTIKESFDAIISTIADIGVLIPEFRQVLRLFNHNKQVQEVLLLFLKDVLDFYFIALKFFRLPLLRFVFEALWPKQKNKIRVVMDHINRITLLLRNEVRLEHIQAEHDARARALEHFESTEKSHRRLEYQCIKADVSPKAYNATFEHLHGRIWTGTGRWLIKDPIFTEWLDVSKGSPNLLWLQGIPGAGKTYLSCTVVESVARRGRALFAFLSYALRSSTTALSILHSLIFQLAPQADDLREVLCQSSQKNFKGNTDSAVELLTALLALAGPVYIIIDGLDEIGEDQRGKLLKQLLHLLETCENTRLLISSRPDADITKILQDKSANIRVDHRNSESIQIFMTEKLGQWFAERDFLPEAQAQIKELLAPLPAMSNGMFLYVKIVLTNIEDLEVHEIRRELQVLPESLDDAYGRVLARINALKPLASKEKARKLLGWIGCSPTPLTVQEMEQALIISADDEKGNLKVTSRLNITKICGSIVEIVDDYVQFVHFTVKEYLFSPRISGFIDGPEATLSLAMCCIAYLCQRHHDPEIGDKEIGSFAISGAYSFHNFSISMWLDLVERASALLPQRLPWTLIDLLQRFLNERYNEMYNGEADAISSVHLKEHPKIYALLCKAAQFRRVYSRSDYNVLQTALWADLDPLTISTTSGRIQRGFEQLLCATITHDEQRDCDAIRRHHGKRLFKCGFLSCSLRRHGFETKSARDIHMKHHSRPWNCPFPGCEFAEGGFLSCRMRDDHLDRFHYQDRDTKAVAFEEPDSDEVRPLLYDLISADKVASVRTLLPQFERLNADARWELCELAASLGSSDMVKLFYTARNGGLDVFSISRLISKMTICACKARNMDTFRFLVSKLSLETVESHETSYRSIPIAFVFPEVLRSDSDDFFEEWMKCVDAKGRPFKNKLSRASFFNTSTIIQATGGQFHREKLLLQTWQKIDLPSLGGSTYVGDALVNVASTTCSMKLAKFLMEHGADVNHRRSEKYLTPLQHAARKTSSEAAELMKYLLLKGADPEISSQDIGDHANKFGVKRLGIRDEKGVKEISKWLGMSWDELLAYVREERQKEQENILKKTDSLEGLGQEPDPPYRRVLKYGALE